jgi:hypothetical protein
MKRLLGDFLALQPHVLQDAYEKPDYGGTTMTIIQAAAIRIKWKQRTDRSPCEHMNLELQWDILGHSEGDYICILCGESVAERKKLVA